MLKGKHTQTVFEVRLAEDPKCIVHRSGNKISLRTEIAQSSWSISIHLNQGHKITEGVWRQGKGDIGTGGGQSCEGNTEAGN